MNNSLLIEKLHIEGFWDQYTVDIPFHSEVNILTGNNGAGKTTILDIAFSLLSNDPVSSRVRSKYRNAILYLSEDSRIEVRLLDDGTNEVNYVYKGESVTFKKFSPYVRCMAVSNFDTSLPNAEMIKKLRDDNPDFATEMDIQLGRWINLYYQYMSAVSRGVDTMIKEGNNNLDQISELYQYSRLMESMCNEFFKDSKTLHITEEGKLMFKLHGQEKLIAPANLSSGEKQLLTLLISTMIQNGFSGVIFWDEPEISLHIAWQQKLIRSLLTLNPNMQLIIATHSPNILYEGWEHRVINLKNAFSHE